MYILKKGAGHILQWGQDLEILKKRREYSQIGSNIGANIVHREKNIHE
jgi:hypothetical protein